MNGDSMIGRSRRSVIADQIRQDILMGVIKPGEAITLSDLAQRFGVSVTPVREAVLALFDEGLVEMQTRKGIRVAELRLTDIADMFKVYTTVAGLMAERATAAVTEEEIEQLEDLHEREAVETDPGKLEQMNWQFHAIINRHAKFILLRRFARMLTRNIPRAYFFQLPEWRETSHADHGALLRAVRARDPVVTRLVAEQHVRHDAEMLTKYLANTGFWKTGGMDAEKAPPTSVLG
jgi:DNA-binding GntR family transcriptional regulator